MPSNSGELSVGCAYFNPFRSEVRLRNYLRFREGIEAAGVPLVTAELTFGDHSSELAGLDGVVSCPGEDILWHKEWLLNRAGRHMVRQGADLLLFLDADVYYPDPDWVSSIRAALARAPLVQGFSTATRMDGLTPRSSVGVAACAGIRKKGRAISYGLAWGFRRDVFEAVSFFPRCILGGADMLISYPMIRRPDGTMDPETLAADLKLAASASDNMRRSMIDWMARLRDATAGAWGHADTPIESFSHGTIADRRYGKRHALIAGLDPDRDLVGDASTPLRWSDEGRTRYADKVYHYYEERAAGERLEERRTVE